MKKAIVILPLFFMLAVSAQINEEDSLKQLLNTKIKDSTRVMVLTDLAEIYSYSSLDTSLILAQQGLMLARQTGFIRGEARGLSCLGIIFWLTGDYSKALEHYLQALKKYESLNDQAGILRTYSDMGIIYHDMGDPNMGISYFQKSKIIAESIKRPDLLSRVLINLGESFEKLNQLDSARIYTNHGYELSISLNNVYGIGIGLNNLGNIYSKMNQDEIALGYYHQSLSMVKETQDIEVLCETTLGMAELFKRSMQADSAHYYARLSLASGQKGGFTKRVLNASYFLSDYFKGLQKVDSAYHYLEITIAAKDLLFNQEKVKEVQNLSFTEKLRQEEIAETQRMAEEKRRENIQLLGIATFIPFFFGLLFVFRRGLVNPKYVRFLGLLGLLLLFEFISLLLDPYISALTHNTPILMLLILIAIASVLVPLNHKLEDLVKRKLTP